ncbi:ABC transporter ATP-binding protein [Methanomethylophilus alvi]|uniref:ABC transporter ATP-binding protein n=1 Tax=Methanomethylophilus alvi TaxID=1291540 RepID=UPI0003394101|nr:ABC transporter ATP-binding protein [Methanomethylophilus alvi]MDY7060899.1 ABC transporter ATP-binding protein [Methanomethylophilus alvi]CDF31020.1 aBC transporter related protein [Methanoculleus sp. CAG:1088]
MTDDSLANIRNSDAGLTGEELLRIEDLRISFGDFEALHGINFSLPKGLLVGLIGPNGCGKSTMMKCISKLHTNWTGKVFIDGQDTAGFKAKDIAKMVANVPAEPGPLFGTTVMELVMLGRYPFVNKVWWESPEDEKTVREALKTFGLDHLRRKSVALCSSGEKQRALIAKAYVQEPKLMLVDEPTSHLDMKYKLEVMEYLQNMARKDMTILVAEHDISLMARYCDMCIIMKKGSIVTIGDPKKVITEDLIREVYEVDARVGLDVDGEIYVLPKRYIK